MNDFNSKKEGAIEPHAAAVISNFKETASNDCVNSDHALRAGELLINHEAGIGVNFELTKVLALECVDEILALWLPEGEQRGVQYVAYNPTRDDGGLGSFQINTESGVWSDFATDDKGGDLISLIAYVGEYKYQEQAAVKILELIAGMGPETYVKVRERVARAKAIPIAKHTPVMPVPTDAKARPTFFGSRLGRPTSTWEYRNGLGQLLLAVNRFDVDGGKEFRPLTYCADSSGHCDWHLKAPPAPRPAYGLDRLAARPDAPVLFTEGEKSADASQRLFPDFVAVTTMNGAKSPEKTDFSPFAGREVYIAPDNDEAGIGYKDALIRLLFDVGADVKAVMRLDLLVKGGVPLAEGYDLADAEADGWTTEHLAAIEGLWGPVAAKASLPKETEMTETGKEQSQTTEKPTKKKSVVELASGFAQQTFGGNLAYFDNQILAYNQGYWSPLNPDVQIKKPILDMLGDAGSISKVKSIFELVQLNAAVFPEDFERRSALICMNNGTVDPTTGELLAHAVDHRLTNRVAINYDVAAQCPLWLRTLNEIFAPDADKAEKIQLLQEYIGYCLIPDTRHHKFVWMVGGGGNGKSLIISIITALIGKQNISYAQIEQLGEKFVRAELQGKLVNISSEMSSSATVTDSYLKQITSGEMITAERKNERPFSFKSYARLIGATNMLPRLLDHSQGFFRRAIILRFNRQFLEAEQDINREANLMDELSGIFNWAIVGLQSLLRRGSFVEPASSKAEAKQYQVHSDPVRQFAEDQLQRTECKVDMVKAGYLFSEYVEWSSDNGYSSMAINKFTERLKDIGFNKTRDKDGRYWNAKYFQYQPNSLTNINGDSSIIDT